LTGGEHAERSPRLSQILLPLATMAGCPLGISLIAPRGRDRGLLDWVADRINCNAGRRLVAAKKLTGCGR